MKSSRWQQHTQRCLLVVAGLVVWLVCAATPASAHAVLISTSPGDGQVLPTQPAQASLTFGEAVSTSLGSLEVLSSTGSQANTGTIEQSGDGHTVIIPLKPALAAGSYVVIWRVISADSHPVSGTFTFSIGHATPIATPPSESSGITVPSTALGLTRGLGFASLLIWLGGAMFIIVLWPQGLSPRRSRLILMWAAAIEALLAAAAIPLQASYAAGVGLERSFDLRLIGDVLGTQYGIVTLTRGGLSLLATLTLLLHTWFKKPTIVASAILGVGAAITWSLAGHAGTGSWQPLTAILDTVHIVSASAWIGGLVWLGLVLYGDSKYEDVRQLLPQWSKWATISVGVIVTSGVFAAYRQVRTLHALVDSQYGVTLLLKTGLVAGTLLVGLRGRQWVIRHTSPAAANAAKAGSAAWRSLRRSVYLEGALAAVILAVTAVLVQTAPPTTELATQIYQHATINGPDTVHVTLTPARIGVNTLTFEVRGATGQPVDVPEISALLSAGDGRVFTAHLTKTAPGVYVDAATILPNAGSYTLTIQLRVDDFDSYPSVQIITVR